MTSKISKSTKIQTTTLYALTFLKRNGLWFIRIGILFWLITLITPPGSRAPLGAPQHVETEKPQVCVHTRLIDEVPEWAMQQSLIAVREMGADTIVEFFPWAYIEPVKGQYHWSQTDKILKHAQNQGVRVIARMGFVPEWARPDPDEQQTTFNYLADDAYDDFADFVVVFSERYAGIVDDIIIWNEPNLAFEWGYRPADPAAYTQLLKAVYERVHDVNPDVNILAGALAPTIEPEGSPNGMNDILFLEKMYEVGAKEYFDALAVHTYGFNEAPQAEPAFNQLNFRRAELLHEVMTAYGDSEKPVYITESGWNDHPRWTKAVRPSQRIAYTIDGLKWAEKNWPWAEKICIWALRYPRPVYSYPDNFTLITPDFQFKPIYYAIQAFARGWQQMDSLWLEPPEND